MNGAFVASITISINKAYTAIAFHQQTANLQEPTRPDGPIFGLSDAHGGRLVEFPGGIPLVRDGEIVGAIGVSTSTDEQDQEVAEAGVPSAWTTPSASRSLGASSRCLGRDGVTSSSLGVRCSVVSVPSRQLPQEKAQ